MIRQLLQEHHVSSQEQLARLLSLHGVSSTQATLSRDLRDMGVNRMMTPMGPRYQFDQRARYMRALLAVVGMEIVDRDVL